MKAAVWLGKELAALGDAERAAEMAAYMKTDMPFHGVPKPLRVPILRALVKEFRPQTHAEYVATVQSLWRLKHREEKYAAIHVAMKNPTFISLASIPLYEQLIREGAWWDFVDDVAARLVGAVLLRERKALAPVMDRWIGDDNLWIRRSAIISQLKHKEATDEDRLFGYCEARAPETEFFIRKAIGWALREYAYTAPKAVSAFLKRNDDKLSGLSVREASKHLSPSGRLLA